MRSPEPGLVSRRDLLIGTFGLTTGLSGCTTEAISVAGELRFQEIHVEQLAEGYELLIISTSSGHAFTGVYVEGGDVSTDGSVICQRELGTVSPDEEPTEVTMRCPKIPGLIALRADEDLCGDRYESDVAYNKGIYDSRYGDQKDKTTYRFETLDCTD